MSNGLGIEMHFAYLDLIEFVKDILSSIENELKNSPEEKTPQDLYYIYFKICKSIRFIDRLGRHFSDETTYFPLLNEYNRCQDIIHKLQNDHILANKDVDFFNRLIHVITRLCQSIYFIQKKVFENGLVREFI